MQKHNRLITRLFLYIIAIAIGGNIHSSWAQSNGRNDHPLLRISDRQLSSQPVIIAYGDMRFTDPSDTVVTNPKVRRWLVDQIAAEKPNALLLGGDVPMRGGNANDYEVFNAETAPWRSAGINVIPALGNHEIYREGKELCKADQPICLDHWWKTFPKLQGIRWYSVQVGSKMYVMNLDSNSSLLPGSAQSKWIQQQLASLPRSVKFVFFNMHHPPVADPEAEPEPDASPRPNEAALAEFLKTAKVAKRVRFIVNSAHVHNYERFLRDGIVYLVSGGGGAKPSPVTRGASDLYQDSAFPNYHYIKFVLRENHLDVEMVRVSDPLAETPKWEIKDRFQIQ